MPTSNAEELRLFLKCTVIGRGVFGPCACCWTQFFRSNNFCCCYKYSVEKFPTKTCHDYNRELSNKRDCRRFEDYSRSSEVSDTRLLHVNASWPPTIE